MGPIEQLVHSTVRIELKLSNGGTATGTGFFMRFLQEENNRSVPVIITNKHVVAGSVSGELIVTVAKDDGTPDLENHITIEVPDFESSCIEHPDPNTDLVALPIGNILTYAEQQGKNIYFIPLGMDLIPTSQERKKLSPMEDIVMIGYPNGIWDFVHNMPVIRKGITATHPSLPWCGKNEFLTDIASFPGSSGSPVFLANRGAYYDTDGSYAIGSRIKLIGIHYAGAMHTASGSIEIVTTPTSNTPIPITQTPNNIGVAINSDALQILEQVVGMRIKDHLIAASEQPET
jgi:hypothetical protein